MTEQQIENGFDKDMYQEMMDAAAELCDMNPGATEEEMGTILSGALEDRLVDWFKRDMTEAREFIDSLLDMEDVDPEHVQKLIGTAASDEMLAVAMTLYIDSMVK
jgi:hypothetical protein